LFVTTFLTLFLNLFSLQAKDTSKLAGEKVYKVLVGKCKEKDHLEHFHEGRKMILKGKWDGRKWIGFLWLRTWTCGRLL